MHVCGSACALASFSHMCGACAVSAGLGEEEEPGDSRAQRRDSDRQAGSRQAACQGASAPTQGLLKLGGRSLSLDCTCCQDALVFNHVLPPIRTSLVPSLTPTPNTPHPQATLSPLPIWFSLKSNLCPFSVASIHKTSSYSGKKTPNSWPSFTPLL